MSFSSPKQPPRLITFKHLIKTHHGRTYFLGGSGVAMAIASSVAMAALLNPRVPIPVVDSLLGSLPRQTAELMAQEPEVTSPTSPTAPTEPTTAAPPTLEPAVAPVSRPVPLWVYGLIISSCLLGSSLLTYALYRLYQGAPRRSKKPKSAAPGLRRRSPIPVSRPQDS
ncbi:hypothetical protein NIES970_02990 [[Synechococcus] sp. NIES-970]|uniref:hypothetical protein n=1 Tax=Picosynechococcus sp. NKBG15041c TaxID=1407650 RepID=UPI00040938F1|nr:hypothetical protein [Picosynechococcus sp. NKBG15041c]BAW95394.1 hypothetical protein NIES970_02990 [[Synechococcus] sp. NIES-970]